MTEGESFLQKYHRQMVFHLWCGLFVMTLASVLISVGAGRYLAGNDIERIELIIANSRCSCDKLRIAQHNEQRVTIDGRSQYDKTVREMADQFTKSRIEQEKKQ